MDVSSTSPGSNSPVSQQRPRVGTQPVGTLSRPKAVATACERCRRRKIRCDGDTPCATCRRFSIVCIRHRKGEAQAALEQRVQELEAQVATFSAIFSGRQSASVTEDLPLLPPFPIAPSPTDSISSPHEYPSVEPGVHDGDTSPWDVPRIQIVGCANPTPTPMATSPSGVRVASHPGTLFATMDTKLMPMHLGANLSPPLSASSSPTWEARCSLSPGSVMLSSPSRRSSVSSLVLDTSLDFPSSFPTEVDEPLIEVPGIGVSPFGEESESSPLPTRVEADGLLDFICEKAPGLGVPLNREMLRALLDTIDDYSQNLPSTNGPSASMARFQVYMAMAAALRLRGDAGDGENYLLGNCYRLALDQAQSPLFWAQPLAHEAASLVVLFARANQASSGLG